MINEASVPEIPLGLGMAFAGNSDAMIYFSSLTKQEQQAIIDRAHNVKSKQEMQSLVDSLGNRE